MVPLAWYVTLSAVLFVIGAAGILLRRNVLVVLMCLELMLNAVCINFVAFGHHLDDLRGQVFAIFIITIAAAEVAIALALLVALMRHRKQTLPRVDEINLMRG